jgi:hypothetical protein
MERQKNLDQHSAANGQPSRKQQMAHADVGSYSSHKQASWLIRSAKAATLQVACDRGNLAWVQTTQREKRAGRQAAAGIGTRQQEAGMTGRPAALGVCG